MEIQDVVQSVLYELSISSRDSFCLDDRLNPGQSLVTSLVDTERAIAVRAWLSEKQFHPGVASPRADTRCLKPRAGI